VGSDSCTQVGRYECDSGNPSCMQVGNCILLLIVATAVHKSVTMIVTVVTTAVCK
jgi:hypothetical protein